MMGDSIPPAVEGMMVMLRRMAGDAYDEQTAQLLQTLLMSAYEAGKHDGMLLAEAYEAMRSDE